MTVSAKINCPGCGAHIEVTATVPDEDPTLRVPANWTAWEGGAGIPVHRMAMIDCRFVSGVENYQFRAWTVQWDKDNPNRVAFYRRAVKDYPGSYTRWK